MVDICHGQVNGLTTDAYTNAVSDGLFILLHVTYDSIDMKFKMGESISYYKHTLTYVNIKQSRKNLLGKE
jgi:hypothetical protein